jgi:succinate dehydrogenase / fumarate reductase cytochrome b subunit
MLVALTGLALFGFLVMHLAGNLLLLVGPETFNAYSEALVSNPLVIPAEIALLVIFLLHAYNAVRVTLSNRAARPTAYAQKSRAGGASRKSTASTTMILTGLVMLVFVVIHVRSFKFGPYYEATLDGAVVRDLSRLVVEAFGDPLTAGFYALVMILVGTHVWHGFWSAFQSLGAGDTSWTRRLQMVGWGLATILAAGFFFIPVWVYFAGSSS